MLQQQQQQQQQQSQSSLHALDPSFLSAQAALNIEDSPPVRIVQIAALVPPLSPLSQPARFM